MEKIFVEGTIVESTPIFGIYNKVVNSNMEVVPQVEFYCINLEEFQSLGTKEELIIMKSSFLMIFKKALSMSHLKNSFQEEGRAGENKDNSNNELYNKFAESIVKSRLVREVIVLKGDV
jgi:hypothetical protein